MRLLIALLSMLPPVVCDAAPPARHRPSSGSSAHRPAAAARTLQPPATDDDSRSLTAQLAELKASKAAAEQSSETLSAELRRVNSELTAIRQSSANVLQIQDERDRLQEQLIYVERELEAIKRAKQGLEEDDRQTWFLVGAGVLAAGIACGVIIPQLRWRKRSGWDSF